MKGETAIFTLLSVGLLILIVWHSARESRRDEPSRGDPKATQDMIRFTRQDMRIAVFFLGAILIMLGVIADRLH